MVSSPPLDEPAAEDVVQKRFRRFSQIGDLAGHTMIFELPWTARHVGEIRSTVIATRATTHATSRIRGNAVHPHDPPPPRRRRGVVVPVRNRSPNHQPDEARRAGGGAINRERCERACVEVAGEESNREVGTPEGRDTASNHLPSYAVCERSDQVGIFNTPAAKMTGVARRNENRAASS